MLTRDAVLAVLQRQGPSIPVQIRKAIGEGDTFMIGAILTELKEAGKVKVSNTKRGGSPFYYVTEHTSRLVELIPDLGEKDRRAARLLQERKVLKDTDQDPLVRVCLRQIKDFAVPLEVKIKEEKQLFWKWYQTPNQEAEQRIRELLGITPKPAPQQPPKEPVEAPAQKAPEAPRTAPAKAAATETREAEEEELPEAVPASKLLKEHDDTGDELLKTILEYFAEKRIQVITKDVKRKNAEIEFEVTLPTAVGRVEYFCKAKSKKKNNDGDLSSAYLQGQAKKLPVLYITTGDVTKKAKDKLKTDFKGLVLVEL